jgi:histidinol dehydrogenase
MIIKNYPPKKDWQSLTKRPTKSFVNIDKKVKKIFSEIQKKGDNALRYYTYLYDKVKLESLKIDKDYIKKNSRDIPEILKESINIAASNIYKFHNSQKRIYGIVDTMPGIHCHIESRAIDNIGIYVPGGTAPLFSTVLMLGIPAKIAGCKKIVLCTPPCKNGEIHPAILYASGLIGIDEIYRTGGIQAIGAMTFGTETIPKVEKIFGPGNQYVTTAKQIAQNFGVAIDMPAGPSELLIVADKYSKPEFIASDLLSQAEHGMDSQVILLSDNEGIINKTLDELEIQLKPLPRKKIATESLKNSYAILLNNISDCISFSNLYAPEHLILSVKNYSSLIKKISNAGSVFLGNFSCESLGDYASGTNHTLPTNGYSKNYSGVTLDNFLKKITFQEVTPKGLRNIGKAVEIMAEAEQLSGHKNAVSIRLKYLKNEKNK